MCFQQGTDFPISASLWRAEACWSNAGLVCLGCADPICPVVWQLITAETGGSPGCSLASGKIPAMDFIPKVKPRGETEEWMRMRIYRASCYSLSVRAGVFMLAQMRHISVPSKPPEQQHVAFLMPFSWEYHYVVQCHLTDNPQQPSQAH